MKDLIKHIKKEGWYEHSTVGTDDGIKQTNYMHSDSFFMLSLSEDSFSFLGTWKLIKVSTGWIKYNSLEHFKIFDGQTQVIDAMVFKYL